MKRQNSDRLIAFILVVVLVSLPACRSPLADSAESSALLSTVSYNVEPLSKPQEQPPTEKRQLPEPLRIAAAGVSNATPQFVKKGLSLTASGAAWLGVNLAVGLVKGMFGALFDKAFDEAAHALDIEHECEE